MPVEIRQWHDIADRFTDGLLLGNGASIAVNPRFNYQSLFESARVENLLSERVQDIFRRFESTDFEYVLRKLWQAKLVNDALNVDAPVVQEAYAQVRSALIAAIRFIHVSPADAAEHLPPIYHFMSRFRTVLSLNYDLIVYWAAMLGNERLENHQFKDGLIGRKGGIGGFLDEDWPRLRKPLKPNQTVTMYFYPHGNLVLVRTASQLEKKVHANHHSLLEGVLAEWAREDVIPIFVSEGTSQQKRQAIRSSSYLSEVYFEAIPDIGRSLVIYGWGMGEQEQHILDQIKQAKPERIAVSVFGGDQQYAQRVEQQLQLMGIQNVVFFDSQSPGCWIHPAEIALEDAL